MYNEYGEAWTLWWGRGMDRLGADALTRAQMGDTEAFGMIVDAYQDRLFTLAYRLLSDASEAQDAVQETFIRIYSHLPRYDGRYAFSTWIYRIATNVCIDRLRQRRAETSLDMMWSDRDEGGYDPHERLAGREPTPEEALLSAETSGEIQRALGDLPDAYRAVLVLRYIQELSLQEIGEVLQAPVSTVKTRLHRGREAMKLLLARVPVS